MVALRSSRCEGGQFPINLPMYYTYILESISFPAQHYIGYTSDLKQRLLDHNSGKSTHTSKYMPWKIKTFVAFDDQQKAQAFERYLKSGSGHAFAKRQL
jgi:predicted GIY-YIG superfamily endonuclease